MLAFRYLFIHIMAVHLLGLQNGERRCNIETYIKCKSY